MKYMKKTFFCLIFFLISVCAVGAFASCKEGDESERAKAKILTNDEKTFVFTADASASGEMSVYDYLVWFQESEVMTFDGSEGDFGFFVTAVNGTHQADDYSTYWSLYTSVTEKDGVIYATTEYGSYDVNGATLASASYGVSALPVFAGETYALVFTESAR